MHTEKLSRLENFRFTKIEASVSESISQKDRIIGSLETAVSASIEDPTQVKEKKVSYITLAVDINGKTKNGDEPFFKIELEIEGIISWLNNPSDELLQEKETIIEVFNPLYAILLQEAMLNATKLQVGSLQKIAPDIRTAIERAK